MLLLVSEGQKSLPGILPGITEERLKALRRELDQELKEIEKRQEGLERITEVLKRLPLCWQDKNPGKYRRHFSLLSSDAEIVQEKDGKVVKINDWDKESVLRDWITGVEGQKLFPGGKILESIGDAKHVACPKCKKSHPLVKELFQIVDGPLEEDEWETVFFIICPSYIETHIIFKKRATF